jgi:serine/threonine protein phosphatase PrpC
VFDGHGGCEVAKYTVNHFVNEIKKNESFKRGDYKNALIETFLHIDKMLLTEAGSKELVAIAKKFNSGGIASNGSDIPY